MVNNLELVQDRLILTIQKARGHNGVDQLRDELLLTCKVTGRRPVDIVTDLLNVCLYSDTESPEHINWIEYLEALREKVNQRV